MTNKNIYKKPDLNFLKEEHIQLLNNEAPLYIINLDELSYQLEILKSIFPQDSIFAYSYKTNYLKPIVDFLNTQRVLSEVVSPFEVDITKNYGIPPERIIYNGPIKSIDSVDYVCSNNGLIQLDNNSDLKLVLDYAKNKKNIRLGIRLNLSSFSEQLASRFGFVIDDDFPQLIETINNHPNLIFESIHVHIADRTISSFKNMFQSILKILKKYSLLKNIKFINVGGGFPSRMDSILLEQINLDFNENNFKKLLADFLYSAREINSNQNLKLICEPGTRLVAPSMSVIGKFFSINSKTNPPIINTNLSRTNFGALQNSIKFPMVHFPKDTNNKVFGEKKKFALSGYTCVEKDILGEYLVDNPQIGDLFMISGIGSYSYVMKSPFIEGDLPVFIYSKNKLRKIRDRETAKDVTARYIV
tara:strand:+ start:2086 stop:3333 length:1248 start_codon:yes stop_codon:yes gene_type:complete